MVTLGLNKPYIMVNKKSRNREGFVKELEMLELFLIYSFEYNRH